MWSARLAIWATLGCGICGFHGGVAYAQATDLSQPQFDTRLYRLPIDSEAMLWTNDAGSAPTGHFIGKIGFHRMSDPLVFSAEGEPELRLLSSVSELQVVGGLAAGFMRFGIDIPVLLRVKGDQLEPATGIGDIALDVKAVAVDREATDAPVGVAGLVRLTVPSGTVDAAVSSRGLGVEVEGIVDRRFGPVLVAGNLGHRHVPTASLGSLEWGSYGYGRLGAGWEIVEDAGVSVDLAGHLVYGIRRDSGVGSPAEGILGGFGRISEHLVLRGGVGTGLSGGVGAPDLRFITSLGFEPREVRDRDGDGVTDRVDACPTRPEDPDGFADEDGCPDPAQKVLLRVRNHFGEAVVGGMMVIQTEYGRKEAGAEVTLDMHPGTYQVTGFAENYADTAAQFIVVAGRNSMVDIDMEPMLGEVRAIVKSAEGDYLEGEIVVDGGRNLSIRNGIARGDLMDGEHVLVVRAEGYQSVSRAVTIRAGQRSIVDFVLEPAKARITAEKIEILETVYFDVNRATIKVESHALLKQVAGILVEHPEITLVRVEGHTDSRGRASTNRRLSALRAESVRDYLVANEVATERLEAVGYGPDQPLDSSSTAAAHELNRRVEFVIVERAGASE